MSLDQNSNLITSEPGTFMSSVQSDLDDAMQPVAINTDNIERVLTSGFDYYGAIPQIADQLRETATRVRKRTRTCLIENGHDLLRCRDKLKGSFHRWVKQECELTVRTAQLAMMVAEHVDRHGGHENFSRLPVAIQYQLAAPSVSDQVRQQVLD